VPAELKASGRKLWRAILEVYELGEHEVIILREACRTVDLIDGLQDLLGDGLMSKTSQGARVHPAAVELRQQRIALARLFAALRIPVDTEGSAPRTTLRGVRGVYGVVS
jgi:hypothetical protein